MQPQSNKNGILLAAALVLAGVFFPQIKEFAVNAVQKTDNTPAPVVVPLVDTFVPSDLLRAALANTVNAALSEPDKSNLVLRAQFYSDLALAIELAGDKIATTEQFTEINKLAGGWTFAGKPKTPAINTAATEFLKSWVIANEAGLPAERRAKLIEGLRGISWAITQATKTPAV